MSEMNRQCLVAVPACNERERIGACLDALAGSLRREKPTVVLLVNNTTDGTGSVAIRAAARLELALHLFEVTLPPERSGAGHARRLAMQHAARLAAGDDAVLMTTDADGRVEPEWLDANLRAIEAGADAVCGMAIIDPDEALAIPQTLHDDDAREVFYATLLDELRATIDPDPFDRWPRHSEESGASIAVRKRCHEAVGGFPPLRSGEDRGFLDALRRIDARIRHAPDARVIVSGRLEGRAAGGMAETMRRRTVKQDEMLDERLEPVLDSVRRAERRAALRETWRSDPAGQSFGAAWEALEAADRVLSRRRPVRRCEIEAAIGQARALRAAMPGRAATASATASPDIGLTSRRPADPAGTSPRVAFPTGGAGSRR